MFENRPHSSRRAGPTWFASWLLCSAPLSTFACYTPELRDCVLLCGKGGICPDEMRCSNGSCTRGRTACVAPEAPSSRSEPCEPGAIRCAAPDRSEVCADDASAYAVATSCDGESPVCIGGECRACAPGALRCASGNSVKTCSNEFAFGDETPCPSFTPECRAGRCEPPMRVEARGAYACALRDGLIWCWGDNRSGQLGAGDRIQRRSGPDDPPLIAVDLDARATTVALGDAHACAISEDETVHCWGENGFGQLGLGDRSNRGDDPKELGSALRPVDLGSTRAPLALALGDRHSCVLLEGGRIRCWGANEAGQLGLGDRATRGDDPGELGDQLAPVDLGSEAVAVALAAGANHTCALLAGGAVKCWGSNEFGQLGLGDTEARGDAPGELGAALSAVELGSAATAIAAGRNHSCAVLSNGNVVCWGMNGARQLGLEDGLSRGTDTTLSLEPVPFAEGLSVRAVAAGASHTCAISSDGAVRCFGLDFFGALGLAADETMSGAPFDFGNKGRGVALGAGRSVIELSAGIDFTCALLDTLEIKCWGLNARGQLGLGDSETRGDDPDELGDALPTVPLD